MNDDDALDRSQRNPNTTDADGAPGEDGSGRPAPTAREGGAEHPVEPGEAGGVDPDAPGRSVTDTTSPEAVEPNEPA